MNNDERKPRLHINIGLLIIIIIVGLLLFKVDIKSKIQSPQFQNNISYIEEQVKSILDEFILIPLKLKAKEVFIDTTNKGIQQIQDNFTKNVLKNPNYSEN